MRGIKMTNTFDWVEIRTRDTEKATKFYENLFGWKVIRMETADGSDYWIFDTGDEPRIQNIRRGAMWLRSDDANLGVVVYVLVEDIEIVLQKVTDLGGEIVLPKTPQGSAFKAYFTDLDGNLFGLWQE
jgi:predicted enzyme related to lactoylglutathione lyase